MKMEGLTIKFLLPTRKNKEDPCQGIQGIIYC